jgi:hypothetical protein
LLFAKNKRERELVYTLNVDSNSGFNLTRLDILEEMSDEFSDGSESERLSGYYNIERFIHNLLQLDYNIVFTECD